MKTSPLPPLLHSLWRPLAGVAVAVLAVACTAAPEPATPTAAPAAPAPMSTTPPPAPAPAAPANATPGRVVLAAGRSAEAWPGVTLTYVALTDDSRCKDGQQCVWSGEVRLAMSLTTAKGTADFELASVNAPVARVHRREIELLAYSACPAELGSGECATLRVGK